MDEENLAMTASSREVSDPVDFPHCEEDHLHPTMRAQLSSGQISQRHGDSQGLCSRIRQ